ncbi:MAG TPA: CoA transferase [Acidimicrobiia bacterium]|nr:CoA transferase [Acidimicrobiia bacterium]
MSAATARPAMLEGVRVVECSLLGPAAITSHLIDLGAEVIKVESPAGDYARKMTWPFMDGTSLLHLHVNRGKQSLVLNLKQAEAIAVFEDLVRESDVVIEAMRPGFLAKMGLGYDHLRELNPKIVMCTISGYGATGPYQNLPSHGIAYDAWSGTIQPVVDDEGFCRIPDQANIGITAGPAFGAIGILAALLRAEKTGEGACMEIAQSDSSAYFDWYRIETWKGYDDYPDDVVTGNPSDDYERRTPGLGGMWEGVRYQYYESSDGHVLFMASEQSFWKNFCEGVGRMDLFEKWPGKTIADHARGNKELQAELRDIFRTKTSQEWIDFADEHNTTIAPANTAQTVRHDPQFQDRFRWVSYDDAGADMLLFPLHVEGEELPVPTKAPEVGEHTDAVLRNVLGYDDAKLTALREAGALG